MQRYRIVFDLDDTLYPERSFALSGFRAAAAWASTGHGITGLEHELERLLDEGHLGQVFPRALQARLGAAPSDLLAGLLEAYRSHEPEIRLFEDGERALERFGAAGPIGLITDGSRDVQRRKVEALDIGARFHSIIYTDDLGGRAYFKPHPRAFELMEAALGGQDARMVYVGDNPAKDFVAPNARGWLTVQVIRPGVAPIHDPAAVVAGGRAAHVVASLDDLAALLGA